MVELLLNIQVIKGEDFKFILLFILRVNVTWRNQGEELGLWHQLRCALGVQCRTNLVYGVGLAISIEVVSEPLAERLQHDLNGQTEGRCCGGQGGWRARRRSLSGGWNPLRYEVIALRGGYRNQRPDGSWLQSVFLLKALWFKLSIRNNSWITYCSI